MNTQVFLCVAFLLLFTTGISWGQVRLDRAALEKIATDFQTEVGAHQPFPRDTERAGKADSSSYADSLYADSLYADIVYSDMESIGFFHGRPLIYTTHNIKASATIGANILNSGGISGFNVDGTDQIIGLWDAGNVRTTHRELVGRTAQRDTTATGASHATHVAGTLAATGLWEVVRGMAPSSFVDSYNWVDDVSEMALAAASGLMLSNHSYGVPLGWAFNVQGDGLWAWLGDPKISQNEDFRFGWYDELSAKWDAIAQAAPNYLMVKSAGNERKREGPRNGEPYHVFDNGWEMSTALRNPDNFKAGYDTIGDAGLAKNVLTVGATESAPWGVKESNDVVMTSFSSWGPTDDGRIKPDVVAPGVMLLSLKAASDEDYGSSSGTSMAAPVVTGAASLLQEMYVQEFGSPALSSTIKGLLIHTTHESGTSPGPDYQFGWGLIDVEKAALHINQASISSRSAAPIPPYEAQIIESFIAPGTVQEWNITVRNAGPFRATLAWIDPPGTVGAAALNDPTPRLINDLDLIIEGPDGTHLPWTLNPADPSQSAQRATNHVDNVEQVFFTAQPGQYVVRVSTPTSQISALQSFSLIIGESEPLGQEMSSISGAVTQQGVGIQEVVVQLQGPKWVNFKTLKDGVFYFSDLPPGKYTVIPHGPLVTFSPASLEITLPQDSDRIAFEMIPPLELSSVELYETSRLLQSGEYDAGHAVSTAAAGGVYALTFVFNSLAPADLEGLYLHLDDAFDSRIMPYSGVRGNEVRDLSLDWTLSAFNSTQLTKRIPAIWFDGNAPTPFDARLPYSVRTATDQIVLADTLTIRVDRPDDMAPIMHPLLKIPGRSYAPPGGAMEVRVGYLDGSKVQRVTALMLDRDDESIILHSIPLRDNGNIENDFDFIAGDGLFSAKFTPRAEANYRLAVQAVDIFGNDNTLFTDVYYSSVPFVSDQPILFWSTYEEGSQSKVHQSAFSDLNVTTSWWDELTRGQLVEKNLSNVDLIVWGKHDTPIKNEADMNLISAFVENGGSLVILGQNPASETSREWMETTFGVRFEQRTSSDDNIKGTNDLQGFSSNLLASARPVSIRAPEATPLLVSGTDILAVQIGRVVVSTVSAASLVPGGDRTDLISRLLYEASGRTELLRPPTSPVFDQVSNIQFSTRTVQLSWEKQPAASFDVEVSSTSDFETTLVSTHTTEPTQTFEGLPRGATLFARVRAINPVETGPWSDLLTFFTRGANQSPYAIVSGDALTLRLQRNQDPVEIDLYSIFADPEKEPLRFEVTLNSGAPPSSATPPHHVGIVLMDSTVVFTPLKSGTSYATFRATDPDEAWASVTYTLSVANNNVPLFNGSDTFESTQFVGTTSERPFVGLFSDADDDPLTFTLRLIDPSILDVRLDNGTALVTAIAPGTGSYVVEASDGFEGGTASFTEFVTVILNQPPQVTQSIERYHLLEGSAISIPLGQIFEDPEDESIAFSLIDDETGNAHLARDSLFVTADRAGAFDLVVQATDPHGAFSIVTIQMAVNDQAALAKSGGEIPSDFRIASVYPLPFSDRTTFVVDVPDPGVLHLSVFTLEGKRLSTMVDQEVNAGTWEVTWNAHDLPAGLYFYRATWNGYERNGALVKTR